MHAVRLGLLAMLLATTACSRPRAADVLDGGVRDGGVPVPPDDQLYLRDGWAIRSSAEVGSGGAELSTPGHDAGDWTSATVPSTVLAALVAAGVYPDPYVGDALESISQA